MQGPKAPPTPIGIWTWLVEVDCVYADKSLARYFGIAELEGARGLPIREFLEAIHPEDIKRVRAEIDAVARNGGRFNESYRVRGVDRKWHSVVATGHCFSSTEGRSSLFAGWLADISEIGADISQALGYIQTMVGKAHRWSSNDPAVRYVLEDVLVTIEALKRAN